MKHADKQEVKHHIGAASSYDSTGGQLGIALVSSKVVESVVKRDNYEIQQYDAHIFPHIGRTFGSASKGESHRIDVNP